jgi:hypothetical protein
VPGVQVDLILGAVRPEADSALSVAAIKVLDEQGPFFGAAGSPFRHCLIISPGQPKLSRA